MLFAGLASQAVPDFSEAKINAILGSMRQGDIPGTMTLLLSMSRPDAAEQVGKSIRQATELAKP
jgi:hypothetical protein